jgi:UDP-N-acetylmuramoyl-tripeptide--D-alanyl-D-alanine ligase
MVLAKEYTVDKWRYDPDSSLTKGFFQWACMSFWEYRDAGWKNGTVFGDCLLALSWWMIHVHQTLERTRNTGYAYEGIIHAYRLAKMRRLKPAMNDLAYTIDTGLYKLTSWQVGGPLQHRNKYLLAHSTRDPLAVGGIMNHRRQALLRIDVTQHQMHAVILALNYVYTGGQ